MKQRVIFTAIVNVIGDLILQKFILKLSGFLFIVLFCMWYVDHIYMLSLALIILLSLLRIWIKRLFRWRLFPSWYRGKDQFPRGVRQQNLNPPVVTLRSYTVNHFTCHQSTSPFYCLFKPPVYVEVLWKNNILNQSTEGKKFNLLAGK